MKKHIGYTQRVQGHPNFMGFQRFINLAYHSGPLYPVLAQ